MTGNVVMGSMLGFAAFGICSVLVGFVFALLPALLRRIERLEKTSADLKRELEEVKEKQL